MKGNYRLINGCAIKLECIDPMPGLIMEGHVESVNLPSFAVLVGLDGWLFRADENGERAVRELDGSLWEIVCHRAGSVEFADLT